MLCTDDSSRNALNILPTYTDYFQLTTATLALNTCSVYVGGTIAGFVSGIITDRLGRKGAMLLGNVLTLLAVILQTAAQNIAMFVAARIIIGFGTGISGVACPTYLAEVSHYQHRTWVMALFNDCWYVGK